MPVVRGRRELAGSPAAWSRFRSVLASAARNLFRIDQETFDRLDAVGDHSSPDRRPGKKGVREVQGPP